MALQQNNLLLRATPGKDPAKAYLESHTLNERPLTSAESTVQKFFENNEAFRDDIVTTRSKTFLNQFSWPDPATKNQDWAYVTERRKTRTDHTERAELLENIIGYLTERGGWFGRECEVTPTHEFDDVANGTDLVATWYKQGTDGKKIIAQLAIDCTLTEDKLDEKADKIIERIDRGELTNLRYFKSKRLGIMGPLKNLPRVVVRFDKSKLDELCRVAIKEISNLKTGSKDFRTYYAQLLFLLEIESQLRSQEQYIKEIEPEQKNKKNLEQLQKSVLSTRRVIGNLILDKKSSLDATSVQRAASEFKHPFSSLSRLRPPAETAS